MEKKSKKLSIRKRLVSFRYAVAGLFHLIREEHNARIHIAAAITVVICGWIVGIDKSEWLAVILCIGAVLTTEIINTAVENICDYISPEHHDKIRVIKDLAAAAVLVSAITSIVVAGCIFIPYMLAAV